MLTETELKEIKDSLEKILPGPWRYVHDDGTVWSDAYRTGEEEYQLGRVCDATGRWALHDPDHEVTIKANLEFIAQARTWIPELVAEVEKHRELVELMNSRQIDRMALDALENGR